MQKVGSLNSDFCQSFRKKSWMDGEKKMCMNVFLFHQCEAPLKSEKVWVLRSAQHGLHWAGMEGASSSGKLFCRQIPLTTSTFCVVTVWPRDFLLVGKVCSSGFGFSNWKQLAWAAICLFNHLPHSMHSCQMTKIRLTLSAKTDFFTNNYFLSSFIFKELSPPWYKTFLSQGSSDEMHCSFTVVCVCLSFILFLFQGTRSNSVLTYSRATAETSVWLQSRMESDPLCLFLIGIRMT